MSNEHFCLYNCRTNLCPSIKIYFVNPNQQYELPHQQISIATGTCWQILYEIRINVIIFSFSYYEPNQGLSALHLTAFSSCIPGTQFLIAQGSDVNAIYKWYSPLHCAAFGDSPETAMILLNNGARVQARTNSPTYSNESALHCAVRANAVACVRLFTVEGKTGVFGRFGDFSLGVFVGADVGEVEFSGISPIHLAAELGHPQCLKIMLETKGVNVNARTKEKEQTPLHLAAEGGNAECIDILLDREADANVKNYR